MKTQLSKKNKYWIESERYLELRHFCRQYPIFVKAHDSLLRLVNSSSVIMADKSNGRECFQQRINSQIIFYQDRIDMIESCCKKTSEDLYDYILAGVTNCWTYEILKVQTNIPCSRNEYYILYRKFFYLLNKERL